MHCSSSFPFVVASSLAFLLASCGHDSSSGGAAATTTAADVAFPPAHAMTESETIVVRGETAGDRPLAGVTVGGVEASSDDGFATFDAMVPLQAGGNELVIEVTDVASGTKHAAGMVEVAREGPLPVGPVDLALEHEQCVLVLDAARGAVTRVDLTTGERSIVASADFGSGPALGDTAAIAVMPAGATAIVAGDGVLLSIDLASGARAIVADDAGVGVGPSLGRLADVAVVDSLHVDVASRTTNSILEVDLRTGDRVVLSGPGVGAGPLWSTASGIASRPGGLLVVDEFADALWSVDVSTGTRSLVSDDATGVGPSLAGPVRVRWETAATHALVASRDGAALIEVDLATGDRSLVSGPGAGSGPPLEEPRGLALGTMTPIALVLDGGGGRSVVSVDLRSGDRAPLFDPRVGSGPRLVAPVDVDFDAGRGRLFVLDPAQDALLAIEGATGDRAFVSTDPAGTLPLTAGVAIAFDAASGRVLCVLGTRIVAIDVASGARTVVSEPGGGSGVVLDDPADLCLDPEDLRAYVANRSPPAIVAVDLATGARTVVSSATVGSGPAFGAELAGIAWDAAARRLLVLDPASGRLFSVEPASGLRGIVSAASGDPLLLGADAIDLDLVRGIAFVTTMHRVVGVVLASGVPYVVSEDGVEPGPWIALASGLRFDPARALLWEVASTSTALFAIDEPGGGRVFASR